MEMFATTQDLKVSPLPHRPSGRSIDHPGLIIEDEIMALICRWQIQVKSLEHVETILVGQELSIQFFKANLDGFIQGNRVCKQGRDIKRTHHLLVMTIGLGPICENEGIFDAESC